MYDFNAYAAHVLKHASPLPRETDLRHAGLGLTSETGEIADALKGVMVYGKARDDTNLKEEAGDLLWFTGLGCKLTGLQLAAVMVAVTAKQRFASDQLLDEYALIACDAAAEAAMLMLDISKGDDDPELLVLLFEELVRLHIQVHKIGVICGFSLADAAEGNKVKLHIRNGGDGFDVAKTLARDKAAEQAAVATARA